ncbi:CAP domain-containing protein [Microbulbifer bruguierae]|uniref:CAP domain-containing protein n=1 Tax=Microbulbifer bruguierae TaxID=3029061 RepID=A0ABY8NCP3_9GAMM|nr:CAP domain-containing protein [Microbulbifer bruguierae]WGL15198.1 CAP domain-containing protein [Microbulbifer bruguierae]
MAIAICLSAHTSAASEPECGAPGECLALDLHNQVRKDLNAGRLPNSPQPSPPVAMLVYDRALARTAYQWSATQCSGRRGHNDQRRAHFIANGGNPAHPWVGENLYFASESLSDTDALTRAVAAWATEARDYRYQPFKVMKTGHYSQLIWNTIDTIENGKKVPRAVGCGVYRCEKGRYRTIVTCNYAPGGNIHGVVPYRI